MLLAIGALAAPMAEAQSTVNYRPYFFGALDDGRPEGTTVRWRLQLLNATTGAGVGAPAGGLTVNVTVSDTTTAGADFLAPANEGARTVTFKEGESSVILSVPTVDDDQDEPNGSITATLTAGAGYSLGSIDSQTSLVQDNDAPVPNLSVTPVSGNGDKLDVSWRAPTGERAHGN